MNDLLIHKTTEAELDNFLCNPVHALLVAGSEGSGRLAIARMLAAALLETSEPETSPSFWLVKPEGKPSITIDQIKELKHFTKLKASSRRVIIVSPADKMQFAAQNSFLKLLEEPPADTIIILTGEAGRLKPTILSRVQRIQVRQLPRSEIETYFGGDELVMLAHQISGGKLGLMHELISQSDHPLMAAAADARKLLVENRYVRLCQVDQLAKDKDRAMGAVQMLGQMADTALQRADEVKGIARWQRVLASSLIAEEALRKNLNYKLVLTKLMLSL